MEFLATSWSSNFAPFISSSRRITSASAIVVVMAGKRPVSVQSQDSLRTWFCFGWWRHRPFGLLKFNICVRCDMAFIVPMHRNKPNITYLLTKCQYDFMFCKKKKKSAYNGLRLCHWTKACSSVDSLSLVRVLTNETVSSHWLLPGAQDPLHTGLRISLPKSWKKNLALTQKIMHRSCHNFAHATTAELSWHVQKCDLIRLLESWLLQIVFTRF